MRQQTIDKQTRAPDVSGNAANEETAMEKIEAKKTRHEIRSTQDARNAVSTALIALSFSSNSTEYTCAGRKMEEER